MKVFFFFNKIRSFFLLLETTDCKGWQMSNDGQSYQGG